MREGPAAPTARPPSPATSRTTDVGQLPTAHHLRGLPGRRLRLGGLRAGRHPLGLRLRRRPAGDAQRPPARPRLRLGRRAEGVHRASSACSPPWPSGSSSASVKPAPGVRIPPLGRRRRPSSLVRHGLRRVMSRICGPPGDQPQPPDLRRLGGADLPVLPDPAHADSHILRLMMAVGRHARVLLPPAARRDLQRRPPRRPGEPGVRHGDEVLGPFALDDPRRCTPC